MADIETGDLYERLAVNALQNLITVHNDWITAGLVYGGDSLQLEFVSGSVFDPQTSYPAVNINIRDVELVPKGGASQMLNPPTSAQFIAEINVMHEIRPSRVETDYIYQPAHDSFRDMSDRIMALIWQNKAIEDDQSIMKFSFDLRSGIRKRNITQAARRSDSTITLLATATIIFNMNSC